MISEIETYLDQLLSIRQDATGLMSGLSDEQFSWRPAPNRWSMAECFDHLNMSAKDFFIPGIDGAIADAKTRGLKASGPFVYPALQQLFLRISEPPPRVKFRAPGKLKPQQPRPLAIVSDEFMQWQDRFEERIRRAEGWDLQKARHRSPVPIWRWRLGIYLAVPLAHERRHVWQAKQVRNAPGFPVSETAVR